MYSKSFKKSGISSCRNVVISHGVRISVLTQRKISWWSPPSEYDKGLKERLSFQLTKPRPPICSWEYHLSRFHEPSGYPLYQTGSCLGYQKLDQSPIVNNALNFLASASRNQVWSNLVEISVFSAPTFSVAPPSSFIIEWNYSVLLPHNHPLWRWIIQQESMNTWLVFSKPQEITFDSTCTIGCFSACSSLILYHLQKERQQSNLWMVTKHSLIMRNGLTIKLNG